MPHSAGNHDGRSDFPAADHLLEPAEIAKTEANDAGIRGRTHRCGIELRVTHERYERLQAGTTKPGNFGEVLRARLVPGTDA